MEPAGSQSSSDDIILRSRRRVRYVTRARVMDVREEFERFYQVDGGSTNAASVAKQRGRSRGWFVQFEGSYESIHFGPTRPHIEVGDLWRITFEKEKSDA